MSETTADRTDDRVDDLAASESGPKLFGRPVFVSDPDLTITDQIHEVLSEEIRAGHWQVGERLPSVGALSKQTGLGRTPIQQAFARLEQEGYVRLEQRSGTFLKSRFPSGRQNLGTIGIALHLDADGGHRVPEGYSHYRLARLLKAVSSVGYVADVQYLETEEQWRRVDEVDGVFGPHVKGVIGLHPFAHDDAPLLPTGKLPFVYLGSNSRDCQPVVAGDTSRGFYEATQRLLKLGHTRIVCYMDPTETAFENDIRMAAHADAMGGAGLQVDAAAAAQSLSIRSGDFHGLRDWLRARPDATAVICMRGSESSHLIDVARLDGRRVPEDLSLVGHGEHQGGQDFPITRVDYYNDRLLQACLELLSEQIRTRRVTVSRILVRPRFCDGQTVAPCPQRTGA